MEGEGLQMKYYKGCIIKTMCLLAMSLFLSACASKMAILPDLKVIDIPALNAIHEAELGDTIVSKGKVYNYDAIELSNEIHAGDGFIMEKITIPPQILIAKLKNKKWTYYFGENVICYDFLTGSKIKRGGLKVSNERVLIFGFASYIGYKPKPQPIIKYIKSKALNKPSYSQELIYNGRSGNNVKFLYRELLDQMMRTPFNQEIQYDLEESKTVGFKGVRIEIIEATNTYLKYRVLKSFPDSM